MKPVYRVSADTELRKCKASELVRFDIAHFPLRFVIRPNHVFRIIKTAVGDIVFRKPERRHVIAVDDKHNGLRILFKRFGERAEKIVHALQRIYIVLHPVSAFGVRHAGDVYPVFTDRIVIGIVAVSLDGHRKDKIPSCARFKRISYLRRQHGILLPPDRIVFDAVHVLDGHERTESEIGVDAVSAVEGCCVVMHRARRVSDR